MLTTPGFIICCHGNQTDVKNMALSLNCVIHTRERIMQRNWWEVLQVKEKQEDNGELKTKKLPFTCNTVLIIATGKWKFAGIVFCAHFCLLFYMLNLKGSWPLSFIWISGTKGAVIVQGVSLCKLLIQLGLCRWSLSSSLASSVTGFLRLLNHH